MTYHRKNKKKSLESFITPQNDSHCQFPYWIFLKHCWRVIANDIAWKLNFTPKLFILYISVNLVSRFGRVIKQFHTWTRSYYKGSHGTKNGPFSPCLTFRSYLSVFFKIQAELANLPNSPNFPAKFSQNWNSPKWIKIYNLKLYFILK